MEDAVVLRSGRLLQKSPPSAPSLARKRPTQSTTPAAGSADEERTDASSRKPSSHFSCHICLDTAKDPVVTHCGHLFCWPCLHRWIHHHSPSRDCPVCKSAVEIGNQNATVIPIYGPDSSDQDGGIDPAADDVPPRPAGKRIDRPRGIRDMIDEVRRTAEVLGTRVQIQTLDRTHAAIDRVLLNLQSVEELVREVTMRAVQLGGLRRVSETGPAEGEDGAGTIGARVRRRREEEDNVYRRMRMRSPNLLFVKVMELLSACFAVTDTKCDLFGKNCF